MGNEESGIKNGQASNGSVDSGKAIKFIFDEIDKFYVSELTKQQFTQQLFAELEKMPMAEIGLLRINRTFIVERLFVVLSQNSKTKCVNCKQLKDFVQLIHRNPEKGIQKSFQLLDLDHDKSISDAQFLNYMDNCFISLMSALERDLADNHFKVCLKEWVIKNKKQFFDQILKIFHQHKRSDPLKWHYSDFKRWILSGENWTMDIELGVKKYRIPLNLLCLFGITKDRLK